MIDADADAWRAMAGAGEVRHAHESPEGLVVVRMLTAAVVSWLGLFAHNALEFPSMAAWGAENAVPALATAALVVAWRWGPRRAAALGLLAWGLLHLVGGALVSVLPLPFLPLEPEQSLTHYGAHALYAMMQAPLVLVAWREWQRPSPRDREVGRS